jgi:hypothetical protein
MHSSKHTKAQWTSPALLHSLTPAPPSTQAPKQTHILMVTQAQCRLPLESRPKTKLRHRPGHMSARNTDQDTCVRATQTRPHAGARQIRTHVGATQISPHVGAQHRSGQYIGAAQIRPHVGAQHRSGHMSARNTQPRHVRPQNEEHHQYGRTDRITTRCYLSTAAAHACPEHAVRAIAAPTASEAMQATPPLVHLQTHSIKKGWSSSRHAR